LLCAFSLSLSLSLSLSVSDFIFADPFLARNLERCTPADWRHTTEAEDSLLDHFSEDEARTEQNQKKAAENFLSRYLWNGNTIINQPRRKHKSNTRGQERDLFFKVNSIIPFSLAMPKKLKKIDDDQA
jgi:hypothetical protein